MTDDENRGKSEDELRRRAEESFNTGVEAYKHGDSRCALERFELALALYREIPGSERNQAKCLFNSGIALRELGDLRGALECYERALALYRGVSGSERNQARCLFNSGIALRELGDLRGALKRFELALALFRGVSGSERNQADCLFNSGIALRELGDLWGALKRFELALALFRGISGSERNQAGCLNNSGVALSGLGDWRGALERFELALALYREIPGSEHDQADCLNNSGNALGELGDLRGALECYELALALCRDIPGSECNQADCLYNIGDALRELGDWRGALKRYGQALALYRGIPGSERNQAKCLNNSGVVSRELGDWRGALECYERALALYREVPGSERNQADCLNNSGAALRELGDLRGALKRFKLALTLLDQYTPEADRIEAERTGARCVLGIGACLINLDEAVFPDHFTRALEVFRRPEHVDHTKSDQAYCLTLIGNCRSATGDLNGAVDAYQQAQEFHREAGHPEKATEINVLLARVLKRKAAAIDSIFERCALLEESLNLTIEAALYLDRSRFRLDRLDDRQRWFQTRAQSTMDLALEVAAELDRPHLISDLIATWRTVGTLDIPRTGPHRTTGRKNPANDQPITATEHFTSAHSAPAEGEQSSLAAGPAVGSQTAVIAHLPRRPGPGLLMPHHRTALAGYNQTPTHTATYR